MSQSTCTVQDTRRAVALVVAVYIQDGYRKSLPT
jgi:hypothetical protein